MVDDFPDADEKHISEAMMMLGNGRANDANIIVDKILNVRPTNPGAHRLKSMIYTHGAHYNEAEQSLLLAIHYSPVANHSYYSELGEVLIQLGRFAEAIDKLSIAIELMRAANNTWELSMASFACAFAHFKLGEFEAASKYLNDAEKGILYYDDELWNKVRILNEINARSNRDRSN